MLSDPLKSRLAMGNVEQWIIDVAFEKGGDRLCIARLHDMAGNAFVNQLRKSTEARHDQWFATCHGLESSQPKRLDKVIAQRNRNVLVRPEGGGVLDQPRESNAPSQAKAADECLESYPLRPLAGDIEPDRCVLPPFQQCGQRPNSHIRSLPGNQPTDMAHPQNLASIPNRP